MKNDSTGTKNRKRAWKGKTNSLSKTWFELGAWQPIPSQIYWPPTRTLGFRWKASRKWRRASPKPAWTNLLSSD
jgi:hypothetical protein